MRFKWGQILVFAACLLLTSCGGGGVAKSGGGSGVGGTGITFVKGNILSVNGELIADANSVTDPGFARYLSNLVIKLAMAQSIDPTSITVFGGGLSSKVNALGEFELPGVQPSNNFVLIFRFNDGSTASLSIGSVEIGSKVTVKDIVIDTNSGSAEPGPIEVEESGEGEGGEEGEGTEEGGAEGGGESGGGGEEEPCEGEECEPPCEGEECEPPCEGEECEEPQPPEEPEEPV